MSVTSGTLTWEALAEAIAAAGQYSTLQEAIDAGVVIVEGKAVTGLAVVQGGAGVATYSGTASALDMAGGLGATGAQLGTAGATLFKTAGGGYKLGGLLTLDLGTVAAAAAPLAGVSLGQNLYSANPYLWTKISETLLPYCYAPNKIQAYLDFLQDPLTSKYSPIVTIPTAIINALKKLFQDEDVQTSPTTVINSQYGSLTCAQLPNSASNVSYPSYPYNKISGNGSAVAVRTSGDANTVVWYCTEATEYKSDAGPSYETFYQGISQGGIGRALRYGIPIVDMPLQQFLNIINHITSSETRQPTAGVSAPTNGAEPAVPLEPEEWPDSPTIIPFPGVDPETIPVTPITPFPIPFQPIPYEPEKYPDPTPDEPPEEWPDEEPWPSIIPFPVQPTEPDPDLPTPDWPNPDWPSVIPFPLPPEQPDDWPDTPPDNWPNEPEGWPEEFPDTPEDWPEEYPDDEPWPDTPDDWPEDVPWPYAPPDWWPDDLPWPDSPDDWPEEVPWPEPPVWPDTPDDWPEEVPWPSDPPDWWPEGEPWPDSPDDWPEEYPWPKPPTWPVPWPEEVPYPWPYPYPTESPEPYPDPEKIEEPKRQVDPFIDPWPKELDDPYTDPQRETDPDPDPYRDPSKPDDDDRDPDDDDDDDDPTPPDPPDPSPPTPQPIDPYPTPPEGEVPPPVIPIIPLPFSSTTGLISVYHPTQSELLSFSQWLWVTWQDTTIEKIWNNPFDGVITLFELYCTPTDVGRKNIRSGFLDSGISSETISRYTEINCGSIGVPEFYGNYFDYAPYSKCHVFLPFIGIVELNVDDVVGHGVNITYRIDEYNGSCIAMITCAKSTLVNGVSVNYSTIVYQFSGNCAVEIPIAGGSQAAIKAGMLEAAAWGLGSVVGGIMGGSSLGEIGQGLAQGAASAVHSVVSAKSSVQHSGSFGSSYGAMGGKTPYIIVTRPKQIQVPNYNELYGYQAHKMVKVGNCTGYLRCREVHIISPTASDEEKAQIEQLMKTGVYVTE